jgi:prefoldin subunit 5
MAPKATEETLAEVRDTLLRIETIIQDGLPATIQRLDILIEEVDRVEERLRKIRKKVDEIEPCLEALLSGICGKSCRPPPAASRCYR